MSEIKILLIEDHKMVRDGIKNLLDRHNGFSVIGECATGEEGIKLSNTLRPNVVIMDISLPDISGIEATIRIKSDIPDIVIIMLSMHSDRRFVIESLKAGAMGYVLKDMPFEELEKAIISTFNKQIYISAPVSGPLIMDFINNNKHESSFQVLTEREREVLRLYADGKSTKEIAFLLSLSIKTIETYRKQIMDKLNIRNIAELTKYAIREGLTTL